jgi:hypothetical protein
MLIAPDNLGLMTIMPDTKNWTWVLERPCPECGFESAAIAREDVVPLLRANADGWRGVLAGDDDHVRARPEPQTWSPLEYACHVRDCCRVYDERLRLMLTEDDPLYPNWDQDETAVAERYGEQDPQRVGVELGEAAEALAQRFEQVEGEAWLRPGRRSDGVQFTIESFARYFIHDPIHHLWDVDRAGSA